MTVKNILKIFYFYAFSFVFFYLVIRIWYLEFFRFFQMQNFDILDISTMWHLWTTCYFSLSSQDKKTTVESICWQHMVKKIRKKSSKENFKEQQFPLYLTHKMCFFIQNSYRRRNSRSCYEVLIDSLYLKICIVC